MLPSGNKGEQLDIRFSSLAPSLVLSGNNELLV